MNLRNAGILAAPGILLSILLVGAPSAIAKPKADNSPGKVVFTEYKCNKCHTVKAAGVKRLKPLKEGSRRPPDLSGVGLRHSREWMGRYLQKKETMEGRKHKKKFRGEGAERKALLDWLSALKHDTKSGKK